MIEKSQGLWHGKNNYSVYSLTSNARSELYCKLNEDRSCSSYSIYEEFLTIWWANGANRVLNSTLDEMLKMLETLRHGK